MDFYYNKMSGPSRTAMFTAGKLGVKLNKKEVRLDGEQNKLEYLAMNPLHCVPFLVDGDLSLTESRVISTYLISQYGKNHASLYPSDPKTRAIIDKYLYFDVATLYTRYRDIIHPIMFGATKEMPEEKKEKLQEAFGWLNGFIKEDGFLAGQWFTVADIALFSSLSTMVEVGFDISGHQKIGPWMERCRKELEGHDPEISEGLKLYGNMIRSKISN